MRGEFDSGERTSIMPIPVLLKLTNSSAAVRMTVSDRHAGPAEKFPIVRSLSTGCSRTE